MGVKAKQKGFYDDLTWYWDRSRNVMIPNLQRLIATCRRVGVEVIHPRIATLTRDGRDTTRRYKALGVSTTPDAKEAEILPEVAPQGDEIVLSKLTSSVFNSTTLDNILRNIGIQNLIVVGLATDGCVESTVRSATEKDYSVILVEDACGTIAPQLHEAASGVVVEGLGFMFNNAMQAFHPYPGHPNSIAPGKARITGMAPTIVLKEGRPWLVVSSLGGTKILTGVMQVIVNIIDFGMTPVEAVSAPRVHCEDEQVDLESRTYFATQEALQARGHKVVKSERSYDPAFSRVHLATLDPATGRLDGAADPRDRGGLAIVS